MIKYAKRYTTKQFNHLKREIMAGNVNVTYKGDFDPKYILLIYIDDDISRNRSTQKTGFTKTQLMWFKNYFNA